MEQKRVNIVVLIFTVGLIGSFAYLYISQNFFKPPLSVNGNSNTNTVKPPDNTNTVGGTVVPVSASSIKKFASLDEFKVFLDENVVGDSFSYGSLQRANGFGQQLTLPTMQGGVEIDFPQEFADFGGGGEDFSQTNIQVQGVDEADIVKSDGKYIYALSSNDLFIVDAFPAEDSQILSKIEFKSQPSNIFINGDRMVVYGFNNFIAQSDLIRPIRPYSQFVFFKVFDITDRKNPIQVRDLDFEGSYLNARMIGDHVYFITAKSAYDIYIDPRPLPLIIENGERIINDPESATFAFPEVYYFDIPYESFDLTSVHAINVTDSSEEVNTQVYTLDGNQAMYVSRGNMYLTYTQRVREDLLYFEVVKDLLLPRLTDRERERIGEIEAVPNYILSYYERFEKISQIIERHFASLPEEEIEDFEQQLEARVRERYEEIAKKLERTIIHKVAIDNGDLDYKGFGEVQGYVLNQYSMDEDDGYFRIATTRSRSFSQFDDTGGQSYSNLYVLDPSLKVVGSVENLAEGEQIFSVRFMQNRAYLVTFRQTDPFFTIDLSDPRDPMVLGELKIPGFSNYLHPYDDTTIIGFGKQTEENQFGGFTTKGVKVSLFDVADVSNPKEVAQYVVADPSSNSISLNEPKAVLFSRDKNLLVIPITTRGGPQTFPDIDEVEPSINIIAPERKYFNGALVFNIKKDSIELKGRIEHAASTDTNEQRLYNYRPGYYSPAVKRSMYIDDVLYTLSDAAIKMNELDDLDLVKNLELKKEASDDDFTVVN